MALTTIYTGYHRAHSALIGNSLCVGNGGTGGVIYMTPAGGTTNNTSLNGSTSVFNLPAGSTVIFAELILASRTFSNNVGDTFTFKTPTSTNPLSYGTLTTGFSGWSIYSQDVTTLVSAGGAGTYQVSGVKCSINSSLWYFYVVYTDPLFPYKYIYYARGVQEILNTNTPFSFTLNNVFTPTSGPVQSYILIASTGGDTVDKGDLRLNGTYVGNTSVGTWNGLSPYNPRNNIQCGIICVADTNSSNIGLLDTSGTFGSANNNPYSGVNPNPNRTWADITGIDASSALTNGINNVLVTFGIGHTGNAGFLLNTMALEITAYIPPSKQVDKSYANVGDTLTYTIGLVNTATLPYSNIIISDTIPTGTTFVPNSLTLNGTTIAGSPAPPSGVNIGTIPVSGASTITFQVLVSSTIPSPNPIINQAISTFNIGTATQVLASNLVSTTVSTAILSSTKSVSPTFANVGSTLTYTITIKNIGNTTADNILFIDTIPTSTNFVANSLNQDGTLIASSPNPPGVTIPNSVGAGATSTIAFKVTVSTIPTQNPIPNSAAITYGYTIDSSTTPSRTGSGGVSSNIVNTTVNNANFKNISKSVDKAYAICGDTLTYTITLPNDGNVTATNVVFKDTIPSGTSLVPNSVTINGVIQTGANPQTGINVGTISAGAYSVVTFVVQINC